MELPKTIEDAEFFHGFIRREDAETLLKMPGEYLLRCELVPGARSQVIPDAINHTCKYMLSVLAETEPGRTTVAEWELATTDQKWHVASVEDRQLFFDNAIQLTDFYCNPKNTVPLPELEVKDLLKSGMVAVGDAPESKRVDRVQLKKCVKKPKWEIKHSDVTVDMRPEAILGSGNFGCVRKGVLCQLGLMKDVAVKIIEPQEKKKKATDGQKGGSQKGGSQKGGSQKGGSNKGEQWSNKQQNSRAPASTRKASSGSARKGSSRNQPSAEKIEGKTATAEPVEAGSKLGNMSYNPIQLRLPPAEPVGEAASKVEPWSTKQQGSRAGDVGEAVSKAPKVGKQMTAEQLIADTLKEAAAMRDLKHPNVIELFGVVVERPPLMMILDRVNMGSLKAFLDRHRNKGSVPRQQRLSQLAVQAAWGVEYLHSKQVIHRDLAARNCLLDRIMSTTVVKIADFGLSKIGSSYRMGKGSNTQIPVKTMSPEAVINKHFSPHSDVWAFGFLIYEIYSVGKEPLNDGRWNLKNLLDNYVAKKPCPQDIPPNFPPHAIEIIRGCWKNAMPERATMTDVALILEKATGLGQPRYMETRHQADEKKKILESMRKSSSPRKGSAKDSSPRRKSPRKSSARKSNEGKPKKSKEPLERKNEDEPVPPVEDKPLVEAGTKATASKEPVGQPSKEVLTKMPNEAMTTPSKEAIPGDGPKEAGGTKNPKAAKDKDRKKHKSKDKDKEKKPAASRKKKRKHSREADK